MGLCVAPLSGCCLCLLLQVLRVPLAEFRQLMVSGEMMLPSITTAYMALEKLNSLGYL